MRNHNDIYTPGSTFTVTVTITTDEDLSALGVRETVPTGWTFVSVGGDDAPGVTPSPGDTGTLEFAWINIGSSPISFTYTLGIPDDASGTRHLNGQVLYRVGGGEEETATIPQTTTSSEGSKVLPFLFLLL